VCRVSKACPRFAWPMPCVLRTDDPWAHSMMPRILRAAGRELAPWKRGSSDRFRRLSDRFLVMQRDGLPPRRSRLIRCRLGMYPCRSTPRRRVALPSGTLSPPNRKSHAVAGGTLAVAFLGIAKHLDGIAIKAAGHCAPLVLSSLRSLPAAVSERGYFITPWELFGPGAEEQDYRGHK
jgi:hypothetical protein